MSGLSLLLRSRPPTSLLLRFLSSSSASGSLPSSVRIVEVGPRDGLQNESIAVGVEERRKLVGFLRDAGLCTVEAAAFVSPKWVPQMAGAGELMQGVIKDEEARESGTDSPGGGRGVRLPALAPNMKGLEAAAQAGVREVAVFAAASESFSRKNINCSIDESLERYASVVSTAREQFGMDVRGYVSCVAGCPFEGSIAPGEVARISAKLVEMGCYEISLGDTIGVGTPGSIGKLLDVVMSDIPAKHLAVHFHDTYGMAIANILVALQRGISVVDGAVAGLGGCPYAPGAGGNVATEDIVYLCEGMGIKTGVDMDKLLLAGEYVCGLLKRGTVSRVGKALAAAAARRSSSSAST